MDLSARDDEAKFSAYKAGLLSVIGHADRAKPLRDYCEELLMPCERKGVINESDNPCDTKGW